MKLTAEQLAQFDRDGYLFFPSLFSPEETRVLRDEAPRLYAQDRVENVREKGKTVVLISHRPGVVSVADRLLILHEGAVQASGPRDGVLAALKQQREAANS